MRDERMVSTALVLTVNWAACFAYCSATGDSYPWPVFGAFDYAAAFVIVKLLRQPPGLWQCAVSVIYAACLVCHGAVGYLSTNMATWQGWHFIGYAAWAQVAVMGAWIGVDLARRRSLPNRRARSSLAGVDRVAGQSRTSAR
jgi:hypothetical protein